jgi:hypothetical protein
MSSLTVETALRIINMLRRIIILTLIALQWVLAWTSPALANANGDALHRALHAQIAEHHHEDSESHDHDTLEVQTLAACLDCADHDRLSNSEHHHHHDVSVSAALLSQHCKPSISGLAVQNPRILPTMHSAEQRADLRPPQA